MQVKDLGEFGLIGRIVSSLPPPPEHVVVGVGDDVAVLEGVNDEYLLATIDAQVEGVHFELETTNAYQLGRKAVAINVSDIAAMGGTPLWALVSLALPPETEVAFVDELYRGMREEIQGSGGDIVGGNVSKAHGGVFIDLCLLGKVRRDRVLLRSGARDGDIILVTGTLGDSRAGLELLKHRHWTISPEHRSRVVEKHLTPSARLREGQRLGEVRRVSAMLDVSDGLLGDLQHLCDAGRVGAQIYLDKVPVSPACCEVARMAGADPLLWALTGGEDYELLFTVPPEHADAVVEDLREYTGTRCSRVGIIRGGIEGIELVDADGNIEPVLQRGKGWDHFAQGLR